MSLHGVQCALAELFTDAGAREHFDRDGAAFAAARGLTEREREQLDALSSSSIPAYAATLVRKRRAEAARLLPKTHAALGEDFGAAFNTWAARASLPADESRYARDAAGFGHYVLAERDAQHAHDAIRADLRRIRTILHPPWIKATLAWVRAVYRSCGGITR
jgi:hypothetical protein